MPVRAMPDAPRQGAFAGRAGEMATYDRRGASMWSFAGWQDRRGPAEPRAPSPRPLYRTVTVSGRRTTLILDPAFWSGLGEICAREGMTLNELCTTVDRGRGTASLTSAVRVFVLSYFRSATPDAGATLPAEHGAEAPPALNSAFEAVE
jgi:predicted DNA-binding ribbon-helix-helix protein